MDAKYIIHVSALLLVMIATSKHSTVQEKDINIAYGKAPYQKSKIDDNGQVRPASVAVNGILYGNSTEEYTHTDYRKPGEQWWMVDLERVYDIKEIYLFNRYDSANMKRLDNVTVYLSTKNLSPKAGVDIDFTGTKWEKAIYPPVTKSYGYVGVIQLDRAQRARFVAITVGEKEGIISLKEVQIYEKPRTDQSRLTLPSFSYAAYWGFGSGINKSFDGLLDTFGLLKPLSVEKGDRWELTWSTPFVFQFASIQQRDTNFRLKLSYTNSKGENPTWQKCMAHTIDEERDTYVCENNLTPVIRRLKVENIGTGTASISEINVYPAGIQGSQDRSYKMVKQDYTSLKIELDEMRNIPYIYNAYPLLAKSPYKGLEYVIYETVTGGDKTVGSNTFEWNGLSPDTEYTFNINIRISTSPAVEMPGPVKTITARTKACSDPTFNFVTLPSTERYSTTNGASQKWKATIQPPVDVRPNCISTSSIQYKLDDGRYPDSLVFDNLNALTTYNVTVKVTNSAGKYTEKSLLFSTGELVPEKPSNLSVLVVDDKCIALTWKKPDGKNGNITKYEYTCNSTYLNWTATQPPITSEQKVCKLPVGRYVCCEMRAWTSAGHGPASDKVTARTKCLNPAEPKFTIEQNPYGQQYNKKIRVNVKIDEVPQHNCDRVTGYQIILDSLQVKNATSIQDPVEFEGLKPYTNITVTVTAVNDENLNSTTSQHAITQSVEPGNAPGLDLVRTDKTCATFELRKPTQINDEKVTSYEVICNNLGGSMSQKGSSSGRTVQVCNLKSATRAECRATANNSVGASPTSNVTFIYTDVRVTTIITDMKRNLTQAEEAPGYPTIPIRIQSLVVENNNISSYLVIVQELSSNRRKRAVSPPKCDYSNLKNSSAATGQECYITAEISPDNVTGDGLEFYVGDGIVYGGHLNRNVTEGATYRVERAINVSYAGGYSKMIYIDEIEETAKNLRGNVEIGLNIAITTTPSSENPGTVNVALVVGVTLAGVAAVVVIVAFIVVRRRRQKEGQRSAAYEATSDNNNIELTSPATPRETPKPDRKPSVPKKPSVKTKPVAPVKPNNIKEGDDYSTADPYENEEGTTADHSETGLRPSELAEFIYSNKQLITDEFKRLEEIPPPSMTVALLPQNQGKSRYKQLYTGDTHRVLLKENRNGTDYINATHMAGYKKKPGYIAAQGPTEVNVEDFWLMIWQQNPSGIAMTTRATELGRMKCYQYWPENRDSSLTMNDITITLTNTEEWADYTVSTLRVEKDDESRTIKHFYFLSWPDHGVPRDTAAYISYYKRIQASAARMTRPLLVHCSAGVGRTGTYIAMDYLVRQAADVGRLDFYESVRRMRERRPCMIQTEEQYNFLYDVVSEYLSTQKFSLPATRLSSHVAEYGKGRNTQSSIAREYQLINKRVASIKLDCSTGKLRENQSKNRFPEILPVDEYRAYVNGRNGDYINAILMDTYKEKNHCIATQLPMKSTAEDFWRLVLESKVKVVVQLQTESKQDKFYPDSDETEIVFGKVTITRPNDGQPGDVADVINLNVVMGKNSASVCIVLAKSWTKDLPGSATALIQLHDRIEKQLQQSGNGPTIFTCLDGSTRCGLIICATNALDKLKLEQEVDVYSAVLKAKLRRPQFIPDEAQYALIYDVLKEYTEEFSEYANFQ